MLEAGSKAPDFTLKDQNGKTVTLSDFSGKTVVLYFYPKANTSGCTTQAEGIRDHRTDYANAGATVIGVSPDEVKAIKKFDGENKLGFMLLADKDHKVSELYGTWVEKSMYGNKFMGVQRDFHHQRRRQGPQGVSQGSAEEARRCRAQSSRRDEHHHLIGRHNG